MPDNSLIRNGYKEVTFIPFNVAVKIRKGTSVLDAIRDAGLPVSTPCGGKGTCGSCIVLISKGKYKANISAALSENLCKKGYVLACKTEIIDDLVISMPKFQQLSIKTVVDIGISEKNKRYVSGVYDLEPRVKKVEIQIPEPTQEDNYSDLKRLEQALINKTGWGEIDCSYYMLKSLPDILRKNDGQITVILFMAEKSWNIIDIIPGKSKKGIYGIACDIGTTTIVTGLVELENGKLVNSASGFNQQIKCGEDIISRINYAEKPERLLELHRLIINTINDLIERVLEPYDTTNDDIYLASITGNTTMIHLFMNIAPQYIREEPYVPAMNKIPFIVPKDLGLKINNGGRIHISPLVGSYVGGDITAGLLCTPILKNKERISLFIDIGTNGELVIGNRDWIITCACSAGPAFEGGQIKNGMPAAEGAIENIKLVNGLNIKYNVIGETKPKGICGSGLIDFLAESFIHGYVDRNGVINKSLIKEKYVQDDTGEGIIIVKSKDCFWDRDLVVYENDIVNLIRSKAAIYSACSLLLKNLGITFDKIDAFYIAGGFGKNINIENAVNIGLFPDVERSKYRYIGNTSFYGAYLILISDKNKNMVDMASEKMTYIELNTEPGYMNEYSASLFLPHTNMKLFPTAEKLLNKNKRD